MTYLIDTDVVIDWLNGQAPIVQLLSSLRHDGLAISLITCGETYYGVHVGRDSQSQERTFRNFLRFVSVLPVNQTMLREAAKIAGQLSRQGLTTPFYDLVIAHTALRNDLTLITRNLRHYQGVSQLKLYPLLTPR
jgi:tRNA(fMet)-specific endonuclease VapC